jgi:hypothetical protein
MVTHVLILFAGISMGAVLGFFLHALLSSTRLAEDCESCKVRHGWIV